MMVFYQKWIWVGLLISVRDTSWLKETTELLILVCTVLQQECYPEQYSLRVFRFTCLEYSVRIRAVCFPV